MFQYSASPAGTNMAPKIVLVTGCSTGIGLSAAILLANDKNKRFKVYATMRNLEKKGALEEQGKNVLGDTLIIKAMDVCSDDSVNAVVEELLADHQRIDVVSKSFSLSVFSTRFKVFIVGEHSSAESRQLNLRAIIIRPWTYLLVRRFSSLGADDLISRLLLNEPREFKSVNGKEQRRLCYL